MPRGTDKKWKTTRKAVSAAGQKAVGSTATMQERDQESQKQAQGVQREFLTAKGRAGHSQRALKDHVVLSEKVLKDHAVLSVKDARSVATDRADHSAKAPTDRAEHSQKALKDHAVLSVRVLKDHADHLGRVQTDHVVHSAKDVHSEVKENPSAQKREVADSETPRREA